MSHSKDHPIAGFMWLVLAFGLIGLGARAGIERSLGAKAGAEQKAVVNDEIRKAVEIGRGGDYAQAEQLLSALVAKYPDDPDAHFNLGIAQVAQEKEDEADATFQKVLQLEPGDWDALAERAGIRKRRGDVDDAMAMLLKIPAGEGHMKERLEQDPLWADVADGRMAELRKRHNVTTPIPETTLRNLNPEPMPEE